MYSRGSPSTQDNGKYNPHREVLLDSVDSLLDTFPFDSQQIPQAPAADIAAAEATVSAAAAASAAAVDAGADAAAVPGHNAVACNGPTSSQPRPPAPSHHPQKNSPAQILTDGQAQSTLYNSPNSLRHGRHAMGTLANTG